MLKPTVIHNWAYTSINRRVGRGPLSGPWAAGPQAVEWAAGRWAAGRELGRGPWAVGRGPPGRGPAFSKTLTVYTSNATGSELYNISVTLAQIM